jgi:hypothetical protein
MIRDQRHMSGAITHRSPAEVEAYWHLHADQMLERRGFMFANRQDANDFRTSTRKLEAYLNHSRWVADCPMDDCNGGIALWQENPEACCLDCGTIFNTITWPSETEMAKVLIAAISLPFEEERNYDPRRETAGDAVKRMAGRS